MNQFAEAQGLRKNAVPEKIVHQCAVQKIASQWDVAPRSAHQCVVAMMHQDEMTELQSVEVSVEVIEAASDVTIETDQKEEIETGRWDAQMKEDSEETMIAVRIDEVPMKEEESDDQPAMIQAIGVRRRKANERALALAADGELPEELHLKKKRNLRSRRNVSSYLNLFIKKPHFIFFTAKNEEEEWTSVRRR